MALRISWKSITNTLLLIAGLLSIGSSSAIAQTADEKAVREVDVKPALKDLRNLDELRTLFNQEKGAPRVILLLSPT